MPRRIASDWEGFLCGRDVDGGSDSRVRRITAFASELIQLLGRFDEGLAKIGGWNVRGSWNAAASGGFPIAGSRSRSLQDKHHPPPATGSRDVHRV
jgi:hypothetical protein